MPSQPKQRGGSSTNSRSKSGCLTCRGRKVKCDEVKPSCKMCTRLHLQCDYGPEGKTICLHDRRRGAGPIKRRRFTNWRPQKIVPKTPVAMAASLAPAMSSPGPLVASTISSLSSPTVSGTSPCLSAMEAAGSSSNSDHTSSIRPASEYTEYPPYDSPVPQITRNDIPSCVPMNTYRTVRQATPTLADTSLDFSSFDVLGSPSMRIPSPSSYLPSMEDEDYMFFGDLSTPLSPLQPPSTTAIGTSTCAIPTPVVLEDSPADCSTVVHSTPFGNPFGPVFQLVPAVAPSPINSLVLGTTTVVLASFPSRMHLTQLHFEALLLFHQQVGFSIGSKSPVWSTHAILIKLAIHHEPILHLMLAASFSELDWRLNTERGHNIIGGGGSAPGGPASQTVAPSTQGATDTPRQLARYHYDAGQAALQELVAAPRGAAEAGLCHVVVVACFWLEYLVYRRRSTLKHGRWGSHNAFSEAMGDYLHKHQLRRGLMSSEPPSALPTTYSQKRWASPPLSVGAEEDDDLSICEIVDETGNTTDRPVAYDSVQPLPTAAPVSTAKSAKSMVSAERPLPPVKYRSFVSRLLSWLYWYDCAACFFGKGGALSKQFRMRPRSQVGFYETARTTLLDFWDDYTPEEIADDNQNWPALQLINETWVAVHRLNLVYETEETEETEDRATTTGRRPSRRSFSSPSPPDSIAQIARDVHSLRSRYATVFRLSAFAATSGGHRSRLLAMADWAVCHHLALELHLLRAGATHGDLYGEEDCADEEQVCYETYKRLQRQKQQSSPYSPLGGDPSSHRQAVSGQIIHLAERAIRTVGPVELDRFQWPLFWAGVETDNYVYRYFVLSNLVNADFRAALQAVVREQSGMSVGMAGNEGDGSEVGYYTMTAGTGMSIRRLRTICREAAMAA
ncbi:hypothetical protein HMPREF1624_01132 [Sporothrix schenckii ATCC 58251]|uniref:Zn(2)-C6 fungal-type domain-containing protein n=1 Tax=Sporothrix schenckii (strain ATCC 58251 / de Perez 2211183) TaxID=1391915 RepID=U7Q4K9_SPOS1|nr:hypothetical protein HMPREF1624_01132 [Sporothrix schenckii ATCC 58251]